MIGGGFDDGHGGLAHYSCAYQRRNVACLQAVHVRWLVRSEGFDGGHGGLARLLLCIEMKECRIAASSHVETAHSNGHGHSLGMK